MLQSGYMVDVMHKAKTDLRKAFGEVPPTRPPEPGRTPEKKPSIADKLSTLSKRLWASKQLKLYGDDHSQKYTHIQAEIETLAKEIIGKYTPSELTYEIIRDLPTFTVYEPPMDQIPTHPTEQVIFRARKLEPGKLEIKKADHTEHNYALQAEKVQKPRLNPDLNMSPTDIDAFKSFNDALHDLSGFLDSPYIEDQLAPADRKQWGILMNEVLMVLDKTQGREISDTPSYDRSTYQRYSLAYNEFMNRNKNSKNAETGLKMVIDLLLTKKVIRSSNKKIYQKTIQYLHPDVQKQLLNDHAYINKEYELDMYQYPPEVQKILLESQQFMADLSKTKRDSLNEKQFKQRVTDVTETAKDILAALLQIPPDYSESK